MEFLITGNLNGNVERLQGLVEISNPYITFVLGTSHLENPIKLNRSWFYVRSKDDNVEVLAKSDGIDILSRVFMTKEGVSFSGISGVYNPTTIKFTRSEWIKTHKKLDKRKQNCIFLDDVEAVKNFFQKSRLPNLDMFFIADSPEKPVFKELIELLKPRYLFFPSNTYTKEKIGETTFIGLEPVSSPKGKYILRL